jgi:2-C-methyl-D-erythritol 4-phosphate cytidylyltransferase
MGGVAAIIVAGGKGVRMKTETPKQYLMILGVPLLIHTVKAFEKSSLVDSICLVVPEYDMRFCQNALLDGVTLKKLLTIAAGGTHRQESVYNGLKALNPLPEIVLIHDGVRPLVTAEQIDTCVRSAKKTGACILAIPAEDTLKKVSVSKAIFSTVDRDAIWLAQTPQAFRFDKILEAHEQSRHDGYFGTDDASLLERLGEPVSIVRGSRFNIKVTTPEDLLLAECIMKVQQKQADRSTL